MFFDELSNDEWALLAALVSDEPAVRLNRRGRPRAEPRIVANAVLWILTTGEPWSKLPGRYPSGPTCRRRFEEWQLNGTLLEMVRLLSQTGRAFAYIPQPAPPTVAKPVTPVAQAPSVREESLRGVTWRSPESWQAPGVSNSLSQWRSADPIADITRQLSGHAPMQPVSRSPTRSALPLAAAGRSVMRADLGSMAGMHKAGAVNAAMSGLTSAIESARATPAFDDQRNPLSMSLAPRGTQIDDARGYAIFVAAERVPNAMYRAWAEILKDGRRVERSGLVGPRFADADEAEHYAFEWARQWIDRECETLAAAASAHVPTHVSPHASAQASTPVPVTPVPATHAVARPLPSLRHVPEPVAVHHGAPLPGPLSAFRGPLRRYPAEPAAASTGTTESSTSDRFPSYPELISHVG